MTKNFDKFTRTLLERGMHISPHNISDKFDLKFIGTGEGNDNFGYGFYFTENPKVIKAYNNVFYNRGYDKTYSYEVEINVQENELLDWDALIDDQSEYVKDKIKYAVEYLRKYTWKVYSDGGGHVFDPKNSWSNDIVAFNEEQLKEVQYGYGSNFYNWLRDYTGNSKDASEALLKNGVKGIKYFDQFSRKDKKGTRNFVIFDDSLITIINKTEKDWTINNTND